jgi:osmotically-inducible protein OsmY
MAVTPSPCLKKTAWVLACFLFSACRPSDTRIASQAISAAQAIDSGVSVQVSHGVATLTGPVKDHATQLAVSAAVHEVKGVQQVRDETTITKAAQPPPPQVLSAEEQLKRRIDSSFKAENIEGVDVKVAAGEVTLTGQAKTDDLTKIMQIVDDAGPKKIINQIIVNDSTQEEDSSQ